MQAHSSGIHVIESCHPSPAIFQFYPHATWIGVVNLCVVCNQRILERIQLSSCLFQQLMLQILCQLPTLASAMIIKRGSPCMCFSPKMCSSWAQVRSSATKCPKVAVRTNKAISVLTLNSNNYVDLPRIFPSFHVQPKPPMWRINSLYGTILI
jgi:hypothetical protein